jgi:alpha-1,4-digalacturonate transport system permease protein
MKKKETSYSMYMFKQKSVPYLFLAPNLLIFITYIIIPALLGVYYSFTKFDGLHDPKFIGFANYVKLFTEDEKFLIALLNTIKYVAVSVPLTYILSLTLAMIIIQELRAKSFFRATYYWPVMISFIVVGVMWQWILGDTFGVFNTILDKVGIGRISTLTNKSFAWWASVFIIVWSQAGYYMIMFIGGLLSIPTELYEAADIDGANKVQKFFSITLPVIKPTSVLVTILATMTIFKTYPLIVSFTGGGPYDATRFIVQHIYEAAFESYEIGYASAMSVVMLFIVTLFSGINFMINKGGND